MGDSEYKELLALRSRIAVDGTGTGKSRLCSTRENFTLPK
jgi:hypothetical protein